MKKITVSVGIPAYNEEANIGKLIVSILNQVQNNFVLKEIIVVSDLSSDKTDDIVKGFNVKKVKLIRNKKRLGKSLIQNILFKKYSSEILVILDADIAIKSNKFLGLLINPIKKGNGDLVSSRVMPLEPKGIVGRILYQNYKYKTRVFRKWRNADNLYMCCGVARAFSRTLTDKLVFPKIVNEDIYSYLYSKSKGFRFIYQSLGTAFFQLPETIKDHKKQNSHFWNSNEEMGLYFNENYVKDNFNMPNLAIRSTFNFLFNDPIYLLLYLSLLLAMKFIRLNDNHSVSWNVVESTKKLNLK